MRSYAAAALAAAALAMPDHSSAVTKTIDGVVVSGWFTEDFTLGHVVRTYTDLMQPEGLREIATYARGIGVHKDMVLPRDGAGRLQPPTSLVRDAHAAGLLVTSSRSGPRTSSCRPSCGEAWRLLLRATWPPRQPSF